MICIAAIAGLASGGSALAATPTTVILSGPADGSATNLTTPSFTFEADLAHSLTATFECSSDGQAFTACTSPATFPGSPLAEGPYTFTVRAVDAIDGTDPVGATRAFTVDTTAPALNITAGPSGPTTLTSPSFAFTAEGGATVQCRFDGGAFAACTSPHAPPAPLGDGPHTFDVRATDAAGNTAPASRSFTVDTTGAAVSITGGPSGTTSATSPAFSFTSEPGATFECRFDAGAYATCTSPHAPAAPLADGAHQFNVRATDALGNLGAVATRSFTVSSGAPVVLFTAGPQGNTGLKTPSFGFTAARGSGAALSVVECWFDAETPGPCTTATTQVRVTPFADGPHSVTVRATNTLNLVTTLTRSFTVHSGAPSAAFTIGPAAPLTNEPVTFTATSTDADGAITENAWDLDNNNIFETTGASASRSFRTPGTYTVRLRATDEYGAISVIPHTVVVGNRGPVASFAVSAQNVTAGTPVTFIATSTDADGPTPTAAWDLGGGDAFGDGTAGSATRTFTAPGAYAVRLRATDADGATDVATRTITVTAPVAAAPGFLTPPPVIRIAGRLTSRGVSVTLLSVKVPAGASVEIRCAGRSCPVARYRRADGARSALYPVFARRLRAGVVLEIRVTRPATIGKLTRLRIRRNAAPARTDGCLKPGATTAVRCPS